MTGLDKILKHIEEDAAASAQTIIDKAKEEADRIMANAKEEGQQRCEDIRKQSELDIKSVESRGRSAALLQEKKLILEAKQQVISDIIQKAQDSLLNQSDEDYFNDILEMVVKHALPKEGLILFSKRDYNRLAEQFEDRINASLTDTIGATLTIAEETKDINGGFILKYGDIEVNCSFDALFFAAKENLQDKVREVLFK